MAILPEPAGGAARSTSRHITLAGPGRVAYANKESVRTLDLRTDALATLAKAPSEINYLASGPDGRIYVACAADVYRTPAPRAQAKGTRG